ncbi:MAG: DUF2220 family protein [Verrucomicrobia bacterium]|nr:DUF2220 family protein [Verrucomicrobiota bacterium]
MAHEHPDILKAFATRYRESQAGRTGVSADDFTFDYRKLLKAAHADNAEACTLAEEHLRRIASQSRGNLVIETHPRDDKLILLVRLKREAGEEWLFQYVREPSPTEERQKLALLFQSFRETALPAEWIAKLSHQALNGGSVEPFKREDLEGNRELLTILIRVLEWKGVSLIRFASCVICHDSKRLEQLKSRLETALSQICGKTFEDLGLLEKPRQVLLHGPLCLDSLDFASLRGPISISETDIHAATTIRCTAARVLTVENETTFLELSKINRNTLLIQTSYPNRAVLALMACLPVETPIFHFGDTDPAGFEILRDLRERSQRIITPLHMSFRSKEDSPDLTQVERQTLSRLINHPVMVDCRNLLEAMLTSGKKGEFEQESLGAPRLSDWPFY